MNSIFLPANRDEPYATHRNLKKNDVNPVPLRWKQVLCLHLAGKPVKEIKEQTGYSTPMVYRILASKEVIALRQQMLASTQQEFEALFQSIVNTIRRKIDSSNEKVQLEACNMWLKAHGKFLPNNAPSITVTAEDVVMNILNNGVPDAK